MRADAVIAGLAGVAVGGMAAPILFPMAAAAKTASYISSILAAGTLAYGEQSGLFDRMRERQRIIRESQWELFIQHLASQESLELRQIEINELVETLVMIDDLSPIEQLHFLKQLDLAELMPIYQESRLLKQAEEPAIEVPAMPVREPEPVFAGQLQWAVDAVVNQSIQQVQQPAGVESDDTFKEVDLGKAIAEMMVSGDVPLCVMIACAPRTGKTTLLTTTIAWLHKLTDGRCQLRIWNGKEKIDPRTGELVDKFLGLVNDPNRYYPIRTPKEAKYFADQYHTGTEEMGKARLYPDVDICDELNNIRAAVEAYDSANGLKNATIDQVDSDSSLRVTQGTSRNKFTLITSHSSYVSEVGINRSLQDGIYSIVLGKGGALDPIYKALKGTTAIVRNTKRAKQLLTDLESWENSPTRDHSKVVALTNLITGNYELYFAKYIDVSKLQFEPIAQSQPGQPKQSSNDPYEFWDEEPESEVRDDRQPQQQQPAQQPQSTIPTESPLAFLIATLKQWMSELPSPPTDAQLKQKLLEITGQNFSDKALQGLKAELGL